MFYHSSRAWGNILNLAFLKNIYQMDQANLDISSGSDPLVTGHLFDS